MSDEPKISCQTIGTVGYAAGPHRPRPHPRPRPPHPHPAPPAPVPAPAPAPAPAPPTPDANDYHNMPGMWGLLTKINIERVARGLAPLAEHPTLSTMAADHSADMSAHNTITHDGSDGSSMGDRYNRSGYPYLSGGEIVAAGQTSIDQVVTAWINSPLHFAVMFSVDFTEFGAGMVNNFWTVDFGRRK